MYDMRHIIFHITYVTRHIVREVNGNPSFDSAYCDDSIVTIKIQNMQKWHIREKPKQKICQSHCTVTNVSL